MTPGHHPEGDVGADDASERNAGANDAFETQGAVRGKPQAVLLDTGDALRRPLRTLLSQRGQVTLPLGVAVSGGADSVMLAVHAALALREHAASVVTACGPACVPASDCDSVSVPARDPAADPSIDRASDKPLHLLHVHHGLFEEADAWADAVRQLGATLDAPVHILHVQVDTAGGSGTEAAARQARYQALAAAAARHGLRHILLAHHRDDQAETVLLRLLRGAGPAGLAAMSPRTERDGVVYLRPWLDVPRAAIRAAAAAYAATQGWEPVQDPSNADGRYTRAALRNLLVPALDARWPGWQAIVARHARQAGEAARILDEVACEDFAGLEPSASGDSFSLARWRLLSPARQAQVLRHWLAGQGARMPTEARLAELLKQLRQLHSLGHDRHLVWNHADHCVRCVRGRVSIGGREDR